MIPVLILAAGAALVYYGYKHAPHPGDHVAVPINRIEWLGTRVDLPVGDVVGRIEVTSVEGGYVNGRLIGYLITGGDRAIDFTLANDKMPPVRARSEAVLRKLEKNPL